MATVVLYRQSDGFKIEAERDSATHEHLLGIGFAETPPEPQPEPKAAAPRSSRRRRQADTTDQE